MEDVKVIKIGGNVVDNPYALDTFLSDFASAAGAKILVHGGGKVASTIGRELGIEPKMIDGRRVTDADTLRVVTMVYGGLINKNIVASLQRMGCNAVGFTGVDGAMVRSRRRSAAPVDFGEVGDPISVNANLLFTMIGGGFVPIIAPLTIGESGEILNTNADTMAQSIAVALARRARVELCYTFELAGVLDKSGAIIERITTASAAKLAAAGTISGGMLPKIENALKAVSSGVKQVNIGQTIITA